MFRIIQSRLGLRTGIRFLSTGVNTIQPQIPAFMLSNPMKINPISKPSLITQLPMIRDIGKLEKTITENTNVMEIKEEVNEKDDITMQLDSVMRKRRYKIKKHKFRKRRKATKALRRKLRK